MLIIHRFWHSLNLFFDWVYILWWLGIDETCFRVYIPKTLKNRSQRSPNSEAVFGGLKWVCTSFCHFSVVSNVILITKMIENSFTCWNFSLSKGQSLTFSCVPIFFCQHCVPFLLGQSIVSHIEFFWWTCPIFLVNVNVSHWVWKKLGWWLFGPGAFYGPYTWGQSAMFPKAI